jgi:DNA-binding transcriptional ArsR family regulator
VTAGVVYDNRAEANGAQIGRSIRNARRQRGESKRGKYGKANAEAATPHVLTKDCAVPAVIPRTGHVRAGQLHGNAESSTVNRMVQYPSPVDRAFAALADPTRRAVLERLGSGRATISELAEPFGMSLTGMKKHIRLLEEAELVTTEKIGRVRRCMLAPYAFEGISTWLQRLDRFAQVVERTKGDR